MMRRNLSILIWMLFIFIGLVSAGEWWETKPYTEWSLAQADEVLSNSPWAGESAGRRQILDIHCLLLNRVLSASLQTAHIFPVLFTNFECAENGTSLGLEKPAISGRGYFFSAVASISKSSLVSLPSRENAPSFAPKMSMFPNPADFRS
jgi:hypothetical protein